MEGETLGRNVGEKRWGVEDWLPVRRETWDVRRVDEIPQPEPARACHSQPHTCREVRRNARTPSVRFEVVSELRETARQGWDKLYGTAISYVACIIREPPQFRVQESPETPVRASEAITRLLQKSPTRHLCNHPKHQWGGRDSSRDLCLEPFGQLV